MVGAFAQRYMPQEWHDRLLGLRFLSPVMFVPLLEVTYRAGAQDNEMQRLSHMMESFEKIGESPAAPPALLVLRSLRGAAGARAVFDCPFMDQALRCAQNPQLAPTN